MYKKKNCNGLFTFRGVRGGYITLMKMNDARMQMMGIHD